MTFGDQIKALTEDREERVAMALYFSVMDISTCSPERLLELWGLRDRTDYRMQAKRILEVLDDQR